MIRTKKSLPEQIVEETKDDIISPKNKVNSDMLVPSGLTLLNLSCSDTPFGAYHLGKIVTMPGSSQSGKTFLALNVFAEAAADPRFDNYELVMDDVEEACEFDIEYLFGENTAERIIAPEYDGEGPLYSDTIQDFQSSILRRCKQKNPRSFIWVLDSLDALTSDEELEKEYRNALARAKSAEAVEAIKGSYKTEKAKIIGQVLRMIKAELKATNSLLIIIQQIRSKIGVVFGKQTTTSGGNAPYFYSTHQVWLTKVGQIGDPGRKIGTKVKAEITKNKLTGKDRAFDFEVYYDYGVDDAGSMVEFLISEKFIDNDRDATGKIKANSYVIPELGIAGTKNILKDRIRSNIEHARFVQKLCGECWGQIEEGLRLGWQPRY